MLKIQIKRQASRLDRIAQRLAAVQASIIALDNEDLLDVADVFKQQPESSIAQWACTEMTRRKISL